MSDQPLVRLKPEYRSRLPRPYQARPLVRIKPKSQWPKVSDCQLCGQPIPQWTSAKLLCFNCSHYGMASRMPGNWLIRNGNVLSHRIKPDDPTHPLHMAWHEARFALWILEREINAREKSPRAA